MRGFRRPGGLFMPYSTGEWQLERPAPVEIRQLLRRAGGEVWRFLPAWMFLFYGCLLLNTELTNLEPARSDLAYTAVFPLAVFLVFYAARAAWSPEVQNRRVLFFGVMGLCLALPLLNLSYHRPSALSLPVLRLVYELSNFVWAGLLFAHAFRRHPSHAALFFGPGLLYGALLENGGILLGFFSEHHLDTTRLPPLQAPLATILGWCVVLYMATFVVWELRRWLPTLRRSAALSALAVGSFATLLDLQIDPLATAVGCWVWHPTLPPAFHGVPLVNFVAWMCALTPFAYVLFRVQERARLAEGGAWGRGELWRMTALVPAVLTVAAAIFLASTLLLEGPEGPSWAILYRVVTECLSALV